jgi:hypothetical protein
MSAIDTAARRLVDKKDLYQRLDRESKAAARDYRDEERAFWMMVKQEFGDAKTFTLPLGEGYGDIQFQRRETVTARVLDIDAAMEALDDDERHAMFGPQPRKKVMNEHVRERLEAGEPLPPGIDAHFKRYITVTKKG